MNKFLFTLIIFCSCGKNFNNQSNKFLPEINPDHCEIFPSSEVCSPNQTQELIDTKPVFNSCSNRSHSLGEENLGGYCQQGEVIPITFIYLNSESTRLSEDIYQDSLTAIDELNSAFKYKNHQFIKFELDRSIEVIDNVYHNTRCEALGEMTTKYGLQNSLVMVFVNDLEGSCAGSSWIWTFPQTTKSITIAEYRYPFLYRKFTPIIHEFAHTMGLHHTSSESGQSAPAEGLKTFNEYLDIGSISPLRCAEDFSYFIDPQSFQTDTVKKGLSWNSFDNTMYPSFGAKDDDGFFTAGYNYSMSWAFDCWYNFAIR